MEEIQLLSNTISLILNIHKNGALKIKGIFNIINWYSNVINLISSIQRNYDMDNNKLYNISTTDNVSFNILRNIINTSNLLSNCIIIGLIQAIKNIELKLKNIYRRWFQ